MPSISVVIPNYNGRVLLEQNLPSVYAALASSGIEESEIIVADDASADESLGFLRERYPEIVLVTGERNVGFAGNANRGIRAARLDLVLLLNSDVELLGDYFTTQLPLFEFADTFGTAGRIVGVDDQADIVQGAAKYPNRRFGNITVNKNYLPSHPDGATILPSYYLSGANLLADRKKLLELGCLQELFNPYYNEDVDLSLTAWRAGYRLYYVDTACCRHPNSVTIRREGQDKIKRVSKRNKFILHYLQYEGLELRYYLFKLAVKSLFRQLKGDARYVASYREFLGFRQNLERVKAELAPLRRRSHGAVAREVQVLAKAAGPIRIFE